MILTKNYPLLVALFTINLLTACDGSSSDGGQNKDNQVESDVAQSTVLLYSQNAIEQTVVGKAVRVDLSDMSMFSNEPVLQLTELVSLSSTNPLCDEAVIDGLSYQLPAFSSATLCQYRYALEDIKTNQIYRSDKMISQLVVSDTAIAGQYSQARYAPLPSAQLPPLQFSIFNSGSSEEISIDLSLHLATAFPKDDSDKAYILADPIYVLGNGSAMALSDSTSTIKYISDNNDLGGVTRIIYVLTDDFDDDGEGNFQIGAIDISVSSGDINRAPVAENFIWDNAGNTINLDQEYTIDVASNKSLDCRYPDSDLDPASNSCIKDDDSGDKLQLIDAIAYDANAVPNDLVALDSTSLNVTFSRTGIHDISYYISDHNGGYDMGMVRVDIPHNVAPIFKGPHIVYVNSNDTITIKMAESGSELVSDPDVGDTVSLVSVSAPSSGMISSINNSELSFVYTPTATTSGLVPVEVTFTDGKAQSSGDVIFVVEQISPLSLKPDRNVTTDINTDVTIDVASFISGLTSGETVEVTAVVGSQLGTVVIDSTEKNKVVFTPTNNLYGVDDFAFEVKTSLGYVISGDVRVQIGTPPPLEITSIDAVEEDGDVIRAIVDCAQCDVTKYKYQWIINGEEVSTQSFFTITPNQRAYNVVLIVEGEDVFGQQTSELKGFDFFRMVVGTKDTPASNCDEIFDLYNSNFVLAAQDGEYWIGTSSDNSYLTQCDMVTVAEAEEQGKQEAGGYTLVWSYSEKTNLERFENNGKFSQRFKNVHWGSTSAIVNNGRGVVRVDDGTRVNYDDFRVTKAEASRLGNPAITRINYTSDSSVDTIDTDDDETVKNWLVETTGPVSFINGNSSLAGNSLKGKYSGVTFETTGNRLYLGGIYIGTTSVYNSGYGWHIDVDHSWPAKGTFVNNMFGFWGENMYAGSDLFGVCTNPSWHSSRGWYCNGDTVGAMTYHSAINGGEGYVIQWWVK